MSKKYNYTEPMLETMESIIKKVRPIAENCYKYEEMVDEITEKEAGLSRVNPRADEIIRRYCIELCETVMDSRLSQRDKVSILCMVNVLVEHSITGSYLAALSDNDIAWDDMVRNNADKRIEWYDKMGLLKK